MMTSWVPGFGGQTHVEDLTDDDSNLHDLSMEEGADDAAVYGKSVRYTHGHGRKNIETAEGPVSLGDVGASGGFRYIKSRKFIRRAYLGLAIVGCIFVFSILVRLAAKRKPASTGGDVSGLSEREANAVALMQSLALTQEAMSALGDAGSPQRKALQWIANDDELALGIPETNFDTDFSAFLQRYSAAVLAFTWGPEKMSPMGFLSSEDECAWNADYKRPDSRTLRMGLICNGQPHQVVKVVLQTLGLAGTIPPEIEYFRAVQHLHLDGNELTGTLQRSMSQLHELRDLTLTRNKLTGPLPSFLGKSTSLQHIELSKNAFSGPLSAGFAMDLTTNSTGAVADAVSPLKVLSLDNNQLQGPVNTLNHLPNLEELYLANNHMTGQLSSEHFQGMNYLTIFDASRNKLVGKIPNTLLQLPSMAVLDLSWNAFTGQFPQGNSTSLKYINFGTNMVSGVLPKAISKHTGLEYLDLRNNRLSGDLPTQVGILKELQFLFLQHNSLLTPGPLPEFLLNLPLIQSASFKDTALNGTIPDWVGELTLLEMLDLESNNISGTIPLSMGDMAAMKYLFLNGNQLNGTVPDELGDLYNLTLLNLDHNSLTGHVPNTVCDHDFEVLIADCAATPEQTPALLECACCTKCCEPSSQSCNTRDWGIEYGAAWTDYLHLYQVINDGDVFQLIDSSEGGER